MDPVQKAVINHTFGAPLSKARRPVISCNVCQIRFNSEVSPLLHQLLAKAPCPMSRDRQPQGSWTQNLSQIHSWVLWPQLWTSLREAPFSDPVP